MCLATLERHLTPAPGPLICTGTFGRSASASRQLWILVTHSENVRQAKP